MMTSMRREVLHRLGSLPGSRIEPEGLVLRESELEIHLIFLNIHEVALHIDNRTYGVGDTNNGGLAR